MTAADGENASAGDRLAWALGAVRHASERLTGVVERSETDGLDSEVPSTPAWNLRELAHHLGKVQRFWGENVRAADPGAPWGGEPALPSDDLLVGWLRESTVSLCDALEGAGPDTACWTWWGEPATSGAVARHQVQEAAVHGWDAEAVLASPSPLPPDVGDDGVPEFIEIVLGSGAEALPGVVTLRATDTGSTWRILGRAGAGPGGEVERGRRRAEVRGTASDLVLMLYRRIPVSDCIVDGDPLLVASLLSLSDTT